MSKNSPVVLSPVSDSDSIAFITLSDIDVSSLTSSIFAPRLKNDRSVPTSQLSSSVRVPTSSRLHTSLRTETKKKVKGITKPVLKASINEVAYKNL